MGSDGIIDKTGRKGAMPLKLKSFYSKNVLLLDLDLKEILY